MRKTVTSALCLLLATTAAGCGQPAGEIANSDDTANVEIMAPPPASAAPAAPASAAAEPSTTAPAPAPQAARIAYVYRYGLELPVEKAPALMARHEQACTDAGPAVCQVIGSRSSRYGRDQLTAQLEIRATPAFIAGTDTLKGPRMRFTTSQTCAGAYIQPRRSAASP